MQRVNSKTKIVSFIAVALLGFAAVGIVRKVIGQNPPPCLPSFVPMLQAGIAAQAPPPTTVQNITPAIASAAFFFQYGSGLRPC